MLKIKVVKVMERGIKCVRIMELSGCRGKSWLPEIYLDNLPIVYRITIDGDPEIWKLNCADSTFCDIHYGDLYKIAYWEEILQSIREAASRLKAINIDIALEAENWKGEIEYLI